MKINSRHLLLILFGLSLSFSSCSEDDYPGDDEFVVAFKNSSESFSGEENTKDIQLIFSKKAPRKGSISLTLNSENLIYGEHKDFFTTPSEDKGVIKIPIEQGQSEVSFTLRKTTDVLPDEEKNVQFEIVQVEMPGTEALSQGNSMTKISFSESASLDGSITPEVGGPNEPNQVYVSLRRKEETKIRRDIWDLGFYSGEGFYVKLNSSMYMFAGATNAYNIDEINKTDVASLQNEMNFLMEGSEQYVDHPNGNLDQLAISPIAQNNQENPVYLVKMGQEIGTETPSAGGVAVAGEDRGWKKIRILRNEDHYILQYADLNDTSHQEVNISKTPGYNFTFFSLTTESNIDVEPEKQNWDLNFTVNIEVEDLPEGGLTAYGYSDYVKTNNLGGVKAYAVSTDDFSYADFSESDINENEFVLDQRIIGSSWRNTIPPNRELYDNIFYVLKDTEGNYYKLKFTALENENGVRGYPKFKYKLLN